MHLKGAIVEIDDGTDLDTLGDVLLVHQAIKVLRKVQYLTFVCHTAVSTLIS